MKYLFAIVYIIHYMSITKIQESKEMIKYKADQQVGLQRKVAPLFQSIIDQ